MKLCLSQAPVPSELQGFVILTKALNVGAHISVACTCNCLMIEISQFLALASTTCVRETSTSCQNSCPVFQPANIMTGHFIKPFNISQWLWDRMRQQKLKPSTRGSCSYTSNFKHKTFLGSLVLDPHLIRGPYDLLS